MRYMALKVATQYSYRSEQGLCLLVLRGKIMTGHNIKNISIADLHFDPQNPRIGTALSSASDEQILAHMLESERILELVLSIGQQDYFPAEPLVVMPRTAPMSGYWVLEGNRRLTALKLLGGLLSVPARLISLRDAVESAPNKPEKVPCLEFLGRPDVIRYLGFRHITGPKPWEPLEKARYLKLLQREAYSNLPESEQFKSMAQDIGSKSDYVARLLTGLTLYERAESERYFGNANLRPEHISFSLLTTALSYKEITAYLNLQSAQDVSASGLNLNHLDNVFSWVFAQNQQGDTILGESRNLKKLARVVATPAAVEMLKTTGNLDDAEVLADGYPESIEVFLRQAHGKLKASYELLSRVKQPSSSLLVAAQDVFDLAKDVRNVIQSKRDN